MRSIFTLFITLLIAVQYLDAQIIINEFSAANRNVLFDNYGEEEDWIELYNTGAAAVDLGGYYLSDKIDNPTKYVIPAGATVGAGEHFLFIASGREEVSGGFYHTNFKITQTKNEAVILADPSGTVLDSRVIEVPNKLDESYGRFPDGTGDWRVQTNPSPGGGNNNGKARYAEPVSMDLEPGFYSGTQQVALTTAEVDAVIRYTTNGDDPTATSQIYSAPISVDNTTVIRAAVFSNDDDILPGFINTNTYFIDETHTVKVISVSGTGLADLLDGNQFEPIGSLELFEDDGSFIDEATGEYNKHGNDSWAYPQRGIDYIARDQYGYNDDLDDEIFDVKERNDYQRLIIKAAANDNYPFEGGGAHIRDAYVHTLSHLAEMELDERTYEPCIMYLNGEYWGVYELREKVDDHDFTKEYYDQGKQWIDYIKTWGGTWEEYGSWDDWYVLTDYITQNDMSVQANYETAAEDFNMQSLVDYMILNTHIVCADWLNWNTAWWRGRKPDGEAKKWRYTLWDMDASFGHYVNYTGVPTTGPDADPCDNEELDGFSDPEGHVALVTSLLQNEEFHSLYVNRYADLNNSFFSCDYMLGLLDDMIDRIEPEMPRQIETWGGTMAEWQANVQELRDFILTRCANVDGGIADCYEVEGPFPLTVNIEPADSPNAVQVNTFVPTAYPFSGDYFGGTTLNFAAVADEEWVFDHWEVANAEFAPDETALAIQLSIAEDEEITAWFVPAVPCAQPQNVEHDANFTNVTIQWDEFFTTLSHELKYREANSGDAWTVMSVVGNSQTIFGLTECTEYEAELRSICAQATSEIIEYDFATACSSNTANPTALMEFVAFPNPFNDRFAVDAVLAESTFARLEIYAADGRRVWSDAFDLQAGQNTIPVEFTSAPTTGTYFVKLISEDGKIEEVLRIIKM